MIYILSMKELDKEKRKEAQRRLFSYGVFQKGWEMEAVKIVSQEELPVKDCGVEVQRGERGKPYVEGNPWYFNISHSGDYLVICFDRYPVGVDIQEMRPVKKPELIAKRFSEEEKEYALSGGEDTFYKVWCRKEAYAKCVGSGLKDEIFATNLLVPKVGYEFSDETVGENYRMCICRERP